MRHAGPEALDRADGLLERLRLLEELTEPKRGKFSRKGKAFLHFHEDGASLYADFKVDGEWVRLPATTAGEQRELLRQVGAELRS